MSRVLITGVGGFTGRYLAAELSEAGDEVHGTIHGDEQPDVRGVAAFHRTDLGDADAVADVISSVGADKIVHLAAISFVAHSNPAEMYRSNILGTRNLLHALAKGGCAPSAVLVASSANVYGNGREGMIDEVLPLAPANDYGITKAAVELLAGLYGNRLPLIVVRPFNYTGRGQSPKFLIPKIVAHARRRADDIELGNLDVARDFSDVRGVVDAYARLLNCPAATGGTFNICSGRATSLERLIELIAKISGHRLSVRVNPDLVRSDEVKALWGSPARVEGLIGPLAMPPLEETLRWMLEE